MGKEQRKQWLWGDIEQTIRKNLDEIGDLDHDDDAGEIRRLNRIILACSLRIDMIAEND